MSGTRQARASSRAAASRSRVARRIRKTPRSAVSDGATASSPGFEQVAVHRGERSGALVAVAVHSTILGPALGGARMWHYPSGAAAVEDAKRLASAMTLKAAAAGLDLGGGKGVLATPSPEPPRGELRRAMLLDFADLIESLEGRYITAEDVGTSTADMAVIAERTGHVVGLVAERGGSGDPSPITALGVLSAIRACTAARLGGRDLDGVRVCVVGLGHVGGRLAPMLAAEGAELLVSDIDPARRELAADLNAEWVDPEVAMLAPCDVLAPCALGGAITRSNVGELRCAVVCGAANNVLADDGLAEAIADRGVLYAPDFIANAGGLINVYGELHGYPRERGRELARGIETTMDRIVATAEEAGITPLAAARRIAEQRLGAATATRPSPTRGPLTSAA